ncbi:hypothetical protein [Glutamicibacter ardleyensis]|uniref:Uncharacterized protein n=1 Tax=Glutamicibacter ardleyensis TaxID=225894 RepID=A0ABQ2DFI9_9MICC|nr:hypothetical protein [Glutamicibacter ardleyensis]GGJ55961.1 hypothetical protein GCM10007173_13510 [Glutamicibacter ardleyensis]
MSQRFTDAELAAEHWAKAWEIKCLTGDGYSPEHALREGEIIYRFARLPHAHREQPDPNRTTPTIAKYGHVAPTDDMTG